MYINLEIEVIKKDGEKILYLSHNGSSGCKYTIQSAEDIMDYVGDYIIDCISSEYDEDDLDEEESEDDDDEDDVVSNEELGLPDSVVIPYDNMDPEIDDIEESINNYLSDAYGFCVKNYHYEQYIDHVIVNDIEWDTED